MTSRTLIACLGNIFLGDDGFGVAVAQRLAGEDLPEGARVVDYGIRGMHLAYDLAQGWDTTILVDATRRGGAPGTVYVIEPQRPAAPGGGQARLALFDAHGMQPDVMLGLADVLGAHDGRVLVVGCEPASVEEGIGLSAPVSAALDEAVAAVRRLARAADRPPPPAVADTGGQPRIAKG